MTLQHPALVDLLQRAYSAERAAAFAYIGHAGSVRNPLHKLAIRQIELDEWVHRRTVHAIMQQYNIPVSRYYELKFYIIGKIISLSCYVLGRFMPYYFAGRLESGNVCEYFVMLHYFHELDIHHHDHVLYEMGMKEKEHEMYFLERIRTKRVLPFFEALFSWGNTTSFNNVDWQEQYPVEHADHYCQHTRKHTVGRERRSNRGNTIDS